MAKKSTNLIPVYIRRGKRISV